MKPTVADVHSGRWASRPSDTLWVEAAFVSFTSKEVGFTAPNRPSVGTGAVREDEFIVEINYGDAVAPGFVVRPSSQSIVHPHSRHTPTHSRDSLNAVIGLTVIASASPPAGMVSLQEANASAGEGSPPARISMERFISHRNSPSLFLAAAVRAG